MLANIQKQHLVSCNMLYIYIYIIIYSSDAVWKLEPKWTPVARNTKPWSKNSSWETSLPHRHPGGTGFRRFVLTTSDTAFMVVFCCMTLRLEHDWRNFWIHTLTCHRILCSNTWIIKCHNVRCSEYRNHASMTTHDGKRKQSDCRSGSASFINVGGFARQFIRSLANSSKA